jgi:hypothetical protein
MYELFCYVIYVIHAVKWMGVRSGIVVKALATNWQVAGSIPDGVIEIFQ